MGTQAIPGARARVAALKLAMVGTPVARRRCCRRRIAQGPPTMASPHEKVGAWVQVPPVPSALGHDHPGSTYEQSEAHPSFASGVAVVTGLARAGLDLAIAAHPDAGAPSRVAGARVARAVVPRFDGAARRAAVARSVVPVVALFVQPRLHDTVAADLDLDTGCPGCGHFQPLSTKHVALQPSAGPGCRRRTFRLR